MPPPPPQVANEATAAAAAPEHTSPSNFQETKAVVSADTDRLDFQDMPTKQNSSLKQNASLPVAAHSKLIFMSFTDSGSQVTHPQACGDRWCH